MSAEETGYTLSYGSYEDARAMVGTRMPSRAVDFPVGSAMVRTFCALVEDPNPHYWDDAASEQTWGRRVSPPGMLPVWSMAMPWTPQAGRVQGSVSLAPNVPLPGTSMINVSTDVRHHRPIEVGTQLSVSFELRDVSEEKRTRLGVGHFVTTVAHYEDEAGRAVASSTAVLFRYTPRESQGS
jgi:acyl dehydratase